MLMFVWDFEVGAWSRLWKCLIKICVRTCDYMIFISVCNQGTNLKINGSRNDIACFLHIVQASVSSRPPVFFIGDTKTYIFILSKGWSLDNLCKMWKQNLFWAEWIEITFAFVYFLHKKHCFKFLLKGRKKVEVKWSRTCDMT